ncbi:hypothetical protein ABPG75_011598 [Micractinium tetrahymenae]
MAGAGDDLEARWPRWPDGEEGREALHVVLDLPVDQAFLQLYGGLNELRKAFNEAAGDKEYSTTGWAESAEAVQAAAVAPTPPPLASVAGLKPGLLRRASYSGTMMGSKYRNEELHRLLEAAPGSAFKVMTTVLTTAMHGEKFRPVVLSTLRALPDGRTEFRIRTTILFITKPNGFIKAMIDKGARDGQRKNFESLRKILAQFTTVSEAAAAGEAAPAAAATPAAEAAPAAVPTGEPAAAAGLLESVVGANACRRLDPWAAFLHARLAAAVPTLGELVQPPMLLGLLGAICLLSALRLVVDMLAFVRNASAHPRDTIGLLTHMLFRLVDTPESMQEVLASCLIFYTVRLLVNRLADALPAPPRALGRAAPSAAGAAPSSAAAALPAVVGPLAAGVTAVAAAGAAAGAAAARGQSVKPTRSEEQEAEGVKYEGYAEAIAAAQAQPTSPVGAALLSTADCGPAAVEAAAAAAKQPAASSSSSFSMKGFNKYISDTFTPARRSKSSGSALAGAAAASGAASPPLATSPPNGPAGKAEEAAATATAAPAAGSTPGSPPAITGLSGAVAGAAPLAAGAAAAATAAAALAAAAGAAGSPPSPTAPVVRCLSDSDALVAGGAASLSAESWSSALGAGSALGGVAGAGPEPGSVQAGLHHAKSTGALVEPSSSSVSLFARKLRDVLSPTAQPSSPRERPSSGDVSAAASPERGGAFSPTAAQREFRPAMPAHLAPELAGQAVIEEIFENQRLQPFRGWGHTWPGHFLPTDKVNHWSRREHEGFPVLASADFNAIAPPLPEGWQWCEEKWHIDRSGQIIDACDADGWSYGLDFGYVRHPFQPNSGKKKMSDFVRRRRWIRTRVPLALAAQPRATAIAKDSASWEAEAVAAEALAAEADAAEAAAAAAEAGAPAGEAAAAEGQAAAAAEAPAAVEGWDTADSAATEATLAAPDDEGGAQGDEAAGASAAAEAAPASGDAALAAVSGLPAALAASPLAAAAGEAAGPGAMPSLSSEQQKAVAGLESIFAQVEARSAQASMQEALAQTIGSRSSSGTAVPPPPPPPPPAQEERQPAAGADGAPLAAGSSSASAAGASAAEGAAGAEAADAPFGSAPPPEPAQALQQIETSAPAERPSASGPSSPLAAAAAAAAVPGSGPASPAPAAAPSSEDEGESPAVLPGELQRTHTGDPEEAEQGGTVGASAAPTRALGQEAAGEPEPVAWEGGEPQAPAAASEPLAAEAPGTTDEAEHAGAAPLAAGMADLEAGVQGMAGEEAAGQGEKSDKASASSAADSLHLVAHR